MSPPRTILRLGIAVLCCTALVMVFAGNTAFATPKPGGSQLPQYVECTSFNYVQISSNQRTVGGGNLYVYLYRVVDSHNFTVCGYSATASESNGPSGTLTAAVLGFSCSTPVISNSISSTGTMDISTGIGPGDHPNFKGRATIAGYTLDTGCVAG